MAVREGVDSGSSRGADASERAQPWHDVLVRPSGTYDFHGTWHSRRQDPSRAATVDMRRPFSRSWDPYPKDLDGKFYRPRKEIVVTTKPCCWLLETSG